MSATLRPRRCSRVRYATTCSSADDRVKRNENGLRRALPSLSTGRSYRGPFQVGVGDGIAVRIVGRESQRAIDPRLQLLGDDVLEAVGLVVDVVDVHAERFRE